MRRLLTEPLLHFALLGIGFFVLSHFVAPDSSRTTKAGGEIVVTEGRIASITEQFTKVWQRPPSEQELTGLIEDHIREEILYREALAMGLDRDDTIVRRRMRQKMEFISEDISSLEQPSEHELQEFWKKHPERFRQPPRFSFRQIYLNEKKRGASTEADAKALLGELRASGNDQDALKAGDRLMTKHRFDDVPAREVVRALGEQFLEALSTTAVGSWQGPIRSGFGLHLIHVSSRTDGKLPPLSETRDVVLREWSLDKRQETNEALYDNLRKRYEVTIMRPGHTEPP